MHTRLNDVLKALILGSTAIELEGPELNSKLPLKSNSTPHTLTDSTYDLTTKARWAVVGRNKQLDEGTSRQTWKYLELLNCDASV